MAAVARAGCNLVRDRGGVRGRELLLSTGALAIGDVLTGAAGHVQLGVSAVWVDLHELPPARGQDDDDDDARTVILIGVRATPVVTWASVATAGVDAGVFGVWDAARPPGPGSATDASTGFGVLLGRPAMALETGDGWFPAVVGKDADGAVSVVVAGPGVDPTRFKISEPVEVEAGAALPLGADGCPVTQWLLSELDATTRALALTHAAAFAPPSNARRVKPQQLARLGLVATWALRRWHALIAPLLPAEAGVLETIRVATRGNLDWLKPASDMLDYTMSDRAFDRTQVLLQTLDRATIDTMYTEVTPARCRRVGGAALDAIRAHVKLDHDRAKMLQVLSTALYSSLRLHALAGERPDGGAALDAVLARLDEQLPPATLITQLASCK